MQLNHLSALVILYRPYQFDLIGRTHEAVCRIAVVIGTNVLIASINASAAIGNKDAAIQTKVAQFSRFRRQTGRVATFRRTACPGLGNHINISCEHKRVLRSNVRRSGRSKTPRVITSAKRQWIGSRRHPGTCQSSRFQILTNRRHQGSIVIPHKIFEVV